ncbi:hypothetical protein LL06_22520 [Hoeflea sp. BAL378]|uniref:response regulator n=1 Tax=Hoeflea sp. BAL378 TaxID=1547437 RepID=UPI00051382AE|nr:response regulator [Hoeflea sp. BAL378]KGF67387.1 hypothetical protein LL06_22520 [Hoeflea sp. BAL378]
MDRNPKILVVVDEPSLMVDMFFELEGRGFVVEPVKPDEYSRHAAPKAVDVAVFDLHQPNQIAVEIASRLHGQAIPVVTLGRDESVVAGRIAGIDISLPKPVDYDRLAGVLFDLVARSCSVASHRESAAPGIELYREQSSG